MDVGLALPQFDFSVPGEWPLQWDTALRWARRAEALGFDAVWFPDSQLLWRDVWVAAGAAAAATRRIGIGVAVTNVETRHPSVTASARAGRDPPNTLMTRASAVPQAARVFLHSTFI